MALTIALGKPADIYLIDEPSAYLDSEQRIAAAKVIKRCVLVFSYYVSPSVFLIQCSTLLLLPSVCDHVSVPCVCGFSGVSSVLW